MRADVTTDDLLCLQRRFTEPITTEPVTAAGWSPLPVIICQNGVIQ